MNKIKRNFLYLFFNSIFGCLLFIFPHHAIGQVYYCGASAATGFNFNEKSKSYEPTRFAGWKFIMNFDSDNTITIKKNDVNERYTCATDIITATQISCHNSIGYMFNFDGQSGRFVLAKGFGYAFGNHDSVFISYGVCEAF